MSSFDFRFWKKNSSPNVENNNNNNNNNNNDLDSRPLLSSSVPSYSTFDNNNNTSNYNQDDLPLRPPTIGEYNDSSDEDMTLDMSRADGVAHRHHGRTNRTSPQSSQAILDETPATWKNFVSRLRNIQKKEVNQLNQSKIIDQQQVQHQAQPQQTSIPPLSPLSPLSPSDISTSSSTSGMILSPFDSPVTPTIDSYQSGSSNPLGETTNNLSTPTTPHRRRRHHHHHHQKEEPFSIKSVFTKDYMVNTAKKIQKRSPYYIPILSWLPKYDKSNLSGDIIAGITTAIMLIPQGMAYAFLVGIPSIHGLYTGLIPVLVYCIFGTSRQLSVGPEAAVSLIVGTTLKQISDEADVPLTTTELIEMATILSFIVGIFSLTLGLLRFGFLSEVLSRPLIRGFILAIAFTIILDQMDTLLGLTGITGSGWRKVVPIFKNIRQAKPIAYGMSIGGIATLFVLNKLKRMIPEKRTNIIHHIGFFIPSILVVVVAGISITSIFHLADKGLAVLGKNEASFPKPTLPPLSQWEVFSGLLSPGLFITIVGFVESMAISKLLAAKHNYQVSTNRELVAIGMSNLAGSVFLAYPMFASMTRSVVNDKAGARSQLAGFVTFIIILFTCLFLMPVFQNLPRVIMSSIVFVAAVGLIEIHDVIFLWKIKAWKDLFLLTLTFLTTFIFNTEIGLIVSIGMSCFMVIKQSSAPHFSVLGRMPESTKYKDITLFAEARPIDGLIIIRFDESIYFSNVGQVKEILFRIEKLGSAMAHPSETDTDQIPVKGVVFDMRNIPEIDASSIQILHEIVSNYEKRDIVVTFVKLKESLKIMFLRGGFYDLIGTDRFYTNIHEAVIRILGGKPNIHSSYFTTQILVPSDNDPLTTEENHAIITTTNKINTTNYNDNLL